MKALESALQAKLVGDTGAGGLMTFLTGGVHNTVATDPITYPYLVYQLIAGADAYTFTLHINTAYLYQVRVIGQGPDKEAISDALTRVNVLLTRQTLSITGVATWIVQREGDLPDMVELDGDTVYMQVGATYRIEVS